MLLAQPLRFHIFANVLNYAMQRFLFIIFCSLSFFLQAQAVDDVLLTINDSPVSVGEFKRVYEKNLDLVQDIEQRQPKAYLDLFIDYKLKVEKAYDLGLDKNETYQSELASYRKQLVKNYLTDVEVTDELVKEAYDRTKEERRGQHVLVRVTPEASPEDTLIAYNKIIAARNRIINGEDFRLVAKEVSEDPSALKNGGDLGYFKAFRMVYPFENAAYKTEIGKVSQPFRTRFGYHIVQPTDTRPSKGSVTVAHIMVAQEQADSTINPKQRIEDVYKKLKEGAAFETLAKNYSDDNNTAVKGGELRPIEEGQISIPIFEEKAFAMTEIGSYTAPFQTKFGWHIIKLLEKNPIKSYDQMKTSLQQKILGDDRAQVIDDNLNLKLRELYNVGSLAAVKDYFKNYLLDDYKATTIDTTRTELSKVAFTLGKVPYTYKDVAVYLTQKIKLSSSPNKELFVNKNVEQFVTRSIRSYHEGQLETIDPEFNALLREYQEGLLLFDLLETEIWQKAKSDTIGLKEYFKKNKTDFNTKEEVEAIVVTTSNKKQVKAIKKALRSLYDYESVSERVAAMSKDHIVVNRKIAISDLPEDIHTTIGKVSTTQDGDSHIIYKIQSKTASRPRTFEEVKGLVMSAYQKDLEKNFVQTLRNNASIVINDKVLKDIEKAYQD